MKVTYITGLGLWQKTVEWHMSDHPTNTECTICERRIWGPGVVNLTSVVDDGYAEDMHYDCAIAELEAMVEANKTWSTPLYEELKEQHEMALKAHRAFE